MSEIAALCRFLIILSHLFLKENNKNHDAGSFYIPNLSVTKFENTRKV